MKKIILLGLALVFISSIGQAQQDPMFTKYMFNTLIFNPAYAGSKDHMSMTLLHRDQWVGLDEGRPTTQTLTIHTPIKGNRIGVGASLLHDDIGPTKDIRLSGYYAYRMSFNDGKSRLSLGVSASVNQFTADWEQLVLNNTVDPVFATNPENSISPNAGAGIFYYNDHFYLGLSVPNLLNQRFKGVGTDMANQYRHYYLGGGLILPLNLSRTLIFKPSFLVKNSNLFGEFQDGSTNFIGSVGAPTEFDIDLSLLFYEALWLGVSFRSAFEGFNGESSWDSADIWMAYYLRNGFRIGVAYDYTLTEINQASDLSFEVVIGYEFSYKESAILTPRYFF
jgi:type IX secretion system PorP/SprF family membrane protein